MFNDKKYQMEYEDGNKKLYGIMNKVAGKIFSEVCPEECIMMAFLDSWSFSLKNVSDLFVAAIAYEHAKIMDSSYQGLRYQNSHPNTHVRGKEFELVDYFGMYYNKYIKRRDSGSLYIEVNKEPATFTINGPGTPTVWFTIDDGKPFFTIYFQYNGDGAVDLLSDSDA